MLYRIVCLVALVSTAYAHAALAEEAPAAPVQAAPASNSTPTVAPAVQKTVSDEMLQTALNRRLDEARTRLNLSDEQVAKIRPILEEQLPRLRQLAEEYEGKGGMELLGALKELRTLREETSARIARHLTEEQQREAAKMREERQAEARAFLRNRERGEGQGLKTLLFPELNAPAKE